MNKKVFIWMVAATFLLGITQQTHAVQWKKRTKQVGVAGLSCISALSLYGTYRCFYGTKSTSGPFGLNFDEVFGYGFACIAGLSGLSAALLYCNIPKHRSLESEINHHS